ncbi:hypothetical protein [Kibdelosporangium aridum]|uniref:hypothetical protein n=1 Tax=Kibdelosporangium aridum TaxID=2030 RepID=UPI0005245BB6
MAWKKRQQRAAFENLMAALEERTAELILAYVAGKWDAVLGMASVLEESLKPVATEPRMEICLYHVESIQLRVALKREDIDLVRVVARKSNNLEVSRKAFDALQKLEIGPGMPNWRGLEYELETVSNAEGQIMRMRNPDPRLIGTKFFPNLYVPDQDA